MNDITRRDAVKVTAAIAGLSAAAAASGLSVLAQEPAKATTNRVETDSLGPVNVSNDKLWGAETQRSLEHFSIGDDLIPREMIPAYAIVKKAAALVNNKGGRLSDEKEALIVRVCDELLKASTSTSFRCTSG
jgi:aspartate ammonia-lyase